MALALAVFLVLLTIVDQYGWVDRAQPADAIVLLGSMVYPGGVLGHALERRAQHAADLYRAGLAPRVICTGGLTEPYPPTEAEAACGRVAQLGVPAEAVFYETRALNTEENAAFTAALMRSHGWRSAILDSDGFHLWRATLMFERAGLTVYPSPAPTDLLPMEPLERVIREMREVAGIVWYEAKVALGVDATKPPR